MEYIKINDQEYEASISGRMSDSSWGGRSTKTITLKMNYNDVLELFNDNVNWSIISEWEENELLVDQETGEPILDGNGNEQFSVQTHREEYDNSDYSIVGDIIIHNDNTISIKMGKPTELELSVEQNKIFGILLGEEV